MISIKSQKVNSLLDTQLRSIYWLDLNYFQPCVIDALPGVIIDAAAAIPGQAGLIRTGDRHIGMDHWLQLFRSISRDWS